MHIRLLAAVMIVTQFPATVFATGTGTLETEDYVAQVGSSKYTSFTAAYKEVASNETITLLANAEFISDDSYPPCIREGNITIVLGGFTLQGKKKNGDYCLIESKSTSATIQGPGTIETGLSCNGYADNCLTLTDDVLITGDVVVYDGNKLTMTSGKVTGTLTAQGNTTVSLSGGTFGKIKRQNTSSPSFSAMLADGYAYQNASDDTMVKLSSLTGNELNNVKVVKCTTHGEWTEDYACGYCGYVCAHEGFNSATGKCDTCQKDLGVAKVTSGTGENAITTYYKTFKEAYNAVVNKDDTLTLVKDVLLTETEWVNDFEKKLKKAFTFDLNGHSFGIDSTTTNIVFDPDSYPCTVKNGILGKSEFYHTVILDGVASECVVCKATSIVQLKGTCKITSLTCEQRGGLYIYGGSYTSITVKGGKNVGDLLGVGYVYRHNTETDKTYIKRSELSVTELTNVTVTTCPHDSFEDEAPKCDYCGKDCDHANVDTNGKCNDCQTQMAAKVTSGTGEDATTTYYKTFNEACDHAVDGDTITLLANAEFVGVNDTDPEIDKDITIVLSGYTLQGKEGTSNKFKLSSAMNTVMTIEGPGTIAKDVFAGGSLTLKDVEIKGDVTANIGCDLTVTGGSVSGKLLVVVDATVHLSGGTYGTISLNKGYADWGFGFDDILAPGYAYKRGDSFLKLADLTDPYLLENVTVTTCPHDSFEDEAPKCDYCGKDCDHTNVDTNGKCNDCQTQMEAALIRSADGATQYYLELAGDTGALTWAQAGDTVKLLKNVTLTENITINKGLTIDLNGKTLDIGTSELLFKTTATLKNGTVKGNVTAKPNANVKDMKLTVESVTVENGKLWVDGMAAPVSVTVKGGSLNELRVESDGQNAQVKLYGGSYGKIPNDMALIPAKSFLPEGYAYQKNGTSLSLSELGNPLENVTVTKCTAHGAPTDGGLCGYCNTALEASVTVGENTTYYASFTDALDYVNTTTGGATVKVLKDATVSVSATYTLSKSMTLDLNGKYLTPTYAPFITVNGCTLTVKSSESGGYLVGQIKSGNETSEIKVESGKLHNIIVSKGKATITGGEVEILSVWSNATAEISGGTFGYIDAEKAIGSLLAEGYGFCIQENDKKTWYDETCSEKSLGDLINTITVTATKLPITDVSIVKDPDVTNVELGNSVDMTAKVIVAEGYSANDIAYSWRRDGAEVDWDSKWSCQFTDDYIDKDVTVTLEATLDGYTRSTSVTFRGEKATIANYTAPKAKEETLTFGDGATLFVAGNSNDAGMFYYRVDEDGAWVNSVPSNSGLTAGKHTIYWYIAGGDLFKNVGSQSEPAGSFEVTIQKATVTSSDYVVDHQTLSYSATAQKLVTVRLDKAGTKFWYKLGDGDWQTDIPTATDEGTYSVSYYIDGGDNYNDVGSKDKPAGTIKVTIQPREVTITPLNRHKTYGEDDPVLEYQYSIIEANENNYLQLKSAFEAARTGTLSRAEGEDVSAQGYIITLGTLSAGKNFKLTLDTIDMLLTINPKDVSREITELNKQTVFTGIGEFIEPSFEDNGNAITGTLTYSGGINYSDLKSILASYDVGETAVFGYTFTANGNYTGTITGEIEFTVVDVVFDVAEGAVTIKTNGTYGDSWGDLVTLDSSKITATRADSKVEGTYTIVPDSGSLNDLPKAGNNSFKVIFNSKDGAYKNIEVKSGSVTLAKKQLTVSAGTVKISKVYDGTTNMGTPSGDFEIEGTVGTKKASIVVNSWPSYTNENAGMTYGSVSVSLGSIDSLNYTLVSGSVTIPMEITKATLTASNVTATAVYGTKVKDIAVSGEVKFGDNTIEGTWSFDSKNETIPGVTDPGSYTATFTVADTELAKNFNTLTVEVTPTITPKAVTAVLTVPDKQYDGKTDTVVNATIDPADLVSGDSITITGITGTFAQSDVGENLTVKVDTTDKTITGAENYTVTIPTGDIKGNIVNTWQPKNGTEFATPATNGAGWLTEIPTITAKEGYKISLQNKADDKSWTESYLPSSAETTEVTFYVRNETTGAISLPVTYTYKLDKHEGGNKTVATVSIEGIEDVWEELVEDVYFDQFLKENATIKVKAKDTVSGVKKVEYLDSATALTVKQLQSQTGWNVISTATDEDGYAIGTATIPAVDGKQFVCYIRITDNADNVTYFSTDGAEFDTTPPTISGVESGETAYTTRVVTISDNNLAWVTVNGEPVELNAAVMPLSLATVATSEPGVTLKLSGNKEQDYVIKIGDRAGHISTFTIHMKPISSITAAASGLTTGNVTSDSKTMLESMKTTLAKELTNGDLTPEEKQVLEQEQQKVTVLQNKLDTVSSSATTDNIQNAEGITESNIKREDETKLENAKADLEKALTDHKDNLTDDEKKALNDQLDTIDKALKAIENVENVEKAIGDLSKDITSKDSEAVKEAEKTYNALTDHEKSLVSKETVEKLQAAQKTLDRLNTKANAPATGDDSHIVLWCSLLLLSATALAVLDKKRKMSR